MARQPERLEVLNDLRMLTARQGLTVAKVAGSSHLEHLSWVASEESRTGEPWPRIVYLYLRHLILDFENGNGLRGWRPAEWWGLSLQSSAAISQRA
jgi:hypothetical protein